MNAFATLPPWVFWLVGGTVAIFGLFRLRVGLRSAEAEEQAKRQGGLFARGRRIHLLYGVVYLAFGVLLVLTGFGYKPPWAP
jgi:hypothetical protein